MDSSGGPAAIPRLRIPRSGSNSMQDPANSSLSTQAGPSRLPDSRILDEEDIGGITPRAPMIMPLSESHGQEEIQDTPALRLRALLARVPADKSHPVAPSSPESELDAPDFGSSTMQSYAKESLASLFSHARREPGDTPLKVARGRRRRNSVDASDLESGSPRVQKVRQETRDYKGKRKSLSDEETEFSPRKSLNSQSQALTFDILRERLGQSHSQLQNEHLPQDDILDTTTATDLHSEGEESTSFLHDLDFDKSQGSPPAATSTPMQSLHMSSDASQLRNQSNLLDNDSEMREAMMGSDSYENSHPEGNNKSSIADKTPGPSNSRRRHSSAAPPEEASQNTKTMRAKSINSTSFPSPSQSLEESRRSSNVRPPTSILAGLQRRLSTVSLSGTDEGHSRPSSRASSRADSHERSAELEKQRNAEREHAWNRPNMSKLGRFHSERDVSSPSSQHNSNSHSQSLSSRQRTYSQPNRFSLQASPSFRRPPSQASMSSTSSRAHSPALSIRSDRSDMSLDEEEVQLRERNWNAPVPNWTPPSERQRSLSITRIRSPMPFPLPVPASPSPSPGPGRRRRTESLKSPSSSRASSPALSLRSSGSSMLVEDDDPMTKSMSPGREKSWNSPRPKWKSSMSSPSPSPSTSRLRTQSIPTTPSRSPSSRLAMLAASPRPSISPRANTQPQNSRSPASSSPARSLTQPSHLSPRPESPLATKSPKIPSTPSSVRSLRLSSPNTSRPSHIPVRSSKPSLKASIGAIPSISFPEQDSDGTDTEPDDDQANYQNEATPTLRTVPSLPLVVTPPLPSASLAPPAPSNSSPATSPTTPRASEAMKPLLESPPDSPPPSSPSEGPTTPQEEVSEPKFTLPETPPRKASMSSVLRFEDFQTPSPPKGLPDLPGPPSSDDDDTGPLLTPMVGSNTTMMKTPRPPGAWADTPAPAKATRHNLFARSVSFAEESSTEANGPATPVGSLSRAGSAPVPPTPAVPGGWLATPAANKNAKSVRFESMSDPEQSMSEMDVTDVVEVKAEVEETELEQKPEEITRPITPEPPRTPPRSPRSPRKSPAVRVVDEFGRQMDLVEEKKVKINGALTTPRNRSGVRIVDAMGREVEESDSTVSVNSTDHNKELDDEFVMPDTLDETLRRINAVTADLAKGMLADNESGIQDGHGESKIPEMSAAHRALGKLYRDPKTAETVAANARIGRQRNTAISRMLSLRPRTESSVPRAYWWGIMAIQLVVVVIVYRIWWMRSRDSFLTTYYDPFYGELYLYPAKPEPLHVHGHWSSLLLRTWREDGFLSSVGKFFDIMLFLVRKSIWDLWGDVDSTSQGVVAWPPT